MAVRRSPQLFSFAIDVVSTDPDGLDPEAVVGAEASLVFERHGEEIRTIHGMIAEVNDRS